MVCLVIIDVEFLNIVLILNENKKFRFVFLVFFFIVIVNFYYYLGDNYGKFKILFFDILVILLMYL